MSQHDNTAPDSQGPVDRPVRPVSEAGLDIQAHRCTWDGDANGGGWQQYHDKSDQLPDKWDDKAPDEVAALVLAIDADAEIQRLRECLMWLQERHHGGLMRAKIDEALGPNTYSPNPASSET